MRTQEQRTCRDRRAEPRYRINEAAVLKSTEDIAAVMILDISAIGLRVSSPHRLPLNAEVQVEVGGEQIPGFVKHCRCIRAMEFHLGILTATAGSAENRQAARIDHLPILRRAKQMSAGMPIDRRAELRSRTA
jgi:PilZ domain